MFIPDSPMARRSTRLSQTAFGESLDQFATAFDAWRPTLQRETELPDDFWPNDGTTQAAAITMQTVPQTAGRDQQIVAVGKTLPLNACDATLQLGASSLERQSRSGTPCEPGSPWRSCAARSSIFPICTMGDFHRGRVGRRRRGRHRPRRSPGAGQPSGRPVAGQPAGGLRGRSGVSVGRGPKALLLHQGGRLDEARTIYERLLPLMGAGTTVRPWGPVLYQILDLAERFGDTAVGVRLVDALAPRVEEVDGGVGTSTVWFIGNPRFQLGRALALAGRDEEALAALGESIRLNERIGARPDVALARIETARLLGRLNSDRDARAARTRSALAQAKRAVEECRASTCRATQPGRRRSSPGSQRVSPPTTRSAHASARSSTSSSRA